MNNSNTVTAIIQTFVITLAAAIGGLWALYAFLHRHGYEGNIEIDISTSSFPGENGKSIVFFDTTIKNTGERTVSAKPKKFVEDKVIPVYQDELETIYHGCNLQIKRLNVSVEEDTVYDWYTPSNFVKIDNMPDEINLLREYEISKKGEIEFWLSGNQASHLGTVVVLSPGHYLAKVTFIGTRGWSDYCSRLFYFHV